MRATLIKVRAATGPASRLRLTAAQTVEGLSPRARTGMATVQTRSNPLNCYRRALFQCLTADPELLQCVGPEAQRQLQQMGLQVRKLRLKAPGPIGLDRSQLQSTSPH